MSRTNETRHTKWHETYKCKCRLDASVCKINNYGIIINADVNGKNCLIMKDMIKDLFGTLVIVNVSVINRVILENI